MGNVVGVSHLTEDTLAIHLERLMEVLEEDGEGLPADNYTVKIKVGYGKYPNALTL